MQARKMLTKRWKIRVRSAVMFPAVFGGTVGGTRVCPPRRLSSPHLRWDTCVFPREIFLPSFTVGEEICCRKLAGLRGFGATRWRWGQPQGHASWPLSSWGHPSVG